MILCVWTKEWKRRCVVCEAACQPPIALFQIPEWNQLFKREECLIDPGPALGLHNAKRKGWQAQWGLRGHNTPLIPQFHIFIFWLDFIKCPYVNSMLECIPMLSHVASIVLAFSSCRAGKTQRGAKKANPAYCDRLTALRFRHKPLNQSFESFDGRISDTGFHFEWRKTRHGYFWY